MKGSLPKLEGWEETRDAFHQSMQVLRSLGELGRDPMPNAIEYSAYPTAYGATTGPLKFDGGLVYLSFLEAEVGYWKDGKALFKVPLAGESQTTLFDKVFSELAKIGHKLEPSREKVTETTPFEIDAKSAVEIGELNYRIFTAFSRFRARLLGYQTPVVLWPHGFDLSFIHYLDGKDEKKDPHMNFGFAMAGVEKPYFYFYAWPVPEGLIGSENILPARGSWVEQWSTPGGRFEYDDFRETEDPEIVIERTLHDIYTKILPMMGNGEYGTMR